jgi:hypothetical protein
MGSCLDPDLDRYVYIAAFSRESRIKIGISTRVGARLERLFKKHGPCDLLITFVGDREVEVMLHDIFRDFHIEKEWFVLSPEALNMVERIKDMVLKK